MIQENGFKITQRGKPIPDCKYLVPEIADGFKTTAVFPGTRAKASAAENALLYTSISLLMSI